MANQKKFDTKTLAIGAMLTAIVVILQFVCMYFLRFATFSITLTLLPIVIGAATCGIGMSTWLGFVFGLAVLLSGDAAPFMAFNAFGTIVTVLLKGAGAGFVAGVVYKLLAGFNKYAAVVAAAIVTPFINTGIFLIGCRVFFWDFINPMTDEGRVGFFAFALGFIGLNFFIELATNVILCPTAIKIINIVKKGK